MLRQFYFFILPFSFGLYLMEIPPPWRILSFPDDFDEALPPPRNFFLQAIALNFKY